MVKHGPMPTTSAKPNVKQSNALMKRTSQTGIGYVKLGHTCGPPITDQSPGIFASGNAPIIATYLLEANGKKT